MEILQIEQEGIGKLDLNFAVPAELQRYVLGNATPVGLRGDGFQALFQVMQGKGFAVWSSRYWMKTPIILRASSHEPALELRISLRGQIKGTWDKILQPELPAYFYQFSFVPHVSTRALFDAAEYETFDIHFERSFLEDLGLDYKTFGPFIEQVLKDEPVELSPSPRRCPPLMTEAVRAVLHNNYSVRGKAWLLQNNVENILLAALEDVEGDRRLLPALSHVQMDALYEVKRLIEVKLPVYPGNEQLCRKTYLNLFVLNFGFKRLFGMNPYKYYNLLRMERGKTLLLQGEAVSSVAYELGFESPRAFGKAFKEWFGITPREWKKGR